jgi:hypothetical protein
MEITTVFSSTDPETETAVLAGKTTIHIEHSTNTYFLADFFGLESADGHDISGILTLMGWEQDSDYWRSQSGRIQGLYSESHALRIQQSFTLADWLNTAVSTGNIPSRAPERYYPYSSEINAVLRNLRIAHGNPNAADLRELVNDWRDGDFHFDENSFANHVEHIAGVSLHPESRAKFDRFERGFREFFNPSEERDEQRRRHLSALITALLPNDNSYGIVAGHAVGSAFRRTEIRKIEEIDMHRHHDYSFAEVITAALAGNCWKLHGQPTFLADSDGEVVAYQCLIR